MNEPVVVLQDPYHPYAARFIDTYRRHWGLRSVCWYTDLGELSREGWKFPVLRSDAVAAHLRLGPGGLPELADTLARRFDPVAVVPYAEPTVLDSGRLAALLDLPWAQPGVLDLFRDKHALKQRLREAGTVTVNEVLRVAGPQDVAEAVAGGGFDRFVLKPNDGFGNSRVVFFDRRSTTEQVAGYFDSLGGTPVLMESFLDGEEYFVNGQVDGTGEVSVQAVFRYLREAANGRDNIEAETRLVRRRDPGFEVAVRYAVDVIRATGLRRSPFHLELMLDGDSAGLVEVAARLAGGGNAVDMNIVHGSGLDVFRLAAHYYLTADDYGPRGEDWTAYDSRAYRKLSGISTRAERIHLLHGVRAVEEMPQFVRWVQRPRVGDRVGRTVDIMTLPWHLVLADRDEVELDHAAARARSLIRWNDDPGGPRRLAREAMAMRPGIERRWNRLRYRGAIRPS